LLLRRKSAASPRSRWHHRQHCRAQRFRLSVRLASVDTIERRGGLLYAVNTLGGVLGAAAAGFGLPALVGVRASYGIAAGASMAAGLIAIMIGDRQETTPVKKLPLRNETSSAQIGRLRLVAAGTGAIGLGLEVLWTHLFAQVLHNSVYSFTAIVLVFLLAIASGRSLRSRCVMPRRRP
jgi:spermidine synthase